jgi:hypothetical protein
MDVKNLNPMKKTVSASSLREEGARILSVFTKTKDDLAKLNNKQGEYLAAVDKDLDKLRIERSMVVSSMQENTKVISKIEEFLK